MLGVGKIIKLDDNKEYMILNSINLHNINYLYLVTIEKPVSILIVTQTIKEDKVVLEEIKDNDELDYVLSQFCLSDVE